MFLPAATVGVVTETNAEKAIEELKAYEADVATVLRDGRWAVVPATGELGLPACGSRHSMPATLHPSPIGPV